MRDYDPRPLHRRRPAEVTTGTAGAIVGILALLGVDLDEASTQALAGLVVGIAALPAIISAVVDRLRR